MGRSSRSDGSCCGPSTPTAQKPSPFAQRWVAAYLLALPATALAAPWIPQFASTDVAMACATLGMGLLMAAATRCGSDCRLTACAAVILMPATGLTAIQWFATSRCTETPTIGQAIYAEPPG